MLRRFALGCALLGAFALSTTALAAPPPNVTGLAATLQSDGKVKVSWQPASATDISGYRVYYSQKSILENDGAYDDFESVDGNVSEYVLKDFTPIGDRTYFAVMAVNKGGEESAFFVEEASVTFPSVPRLNPPAALSSASSASTVAKSEASAATSSLSSTVTIASSAASSVETASSVSASTPATLQLLSAKAQTPVRVMLEFSADLGTDSKAIAGAISIADRMGARLPIEQITVEGRNVLLQTTKQVSGAVYQVRIEPTLTGGQNLVLDPANRSAYFQGHDGGIAAETESVPVLADVENFTLEAIPEQGSRFYTIIGQWQLPSAAPADASIVVRQSRDNGKTFGEPEILDRSMDGIQVPHVSPESFGVAVYVVDTKGNASRGVFRSVFSLVNPTTASVLPRSTRTPNVIRTPENGSLASSGIEATLLVTVVAGGIAGWRKMRLKTERA